MPYRFTFIGDGVRYSCDIDTIQCTFVKSNGTRCGCKVAIGTDLCHIHLKKEKHLAIKQSNIPNAGKGLFAFWPAAPNGLVFEKGQTIIEYTGEVINRDTLVERYGLNTAPYVAQLKEGTFIDAAKIRDAGSSANTQRIRRDNNAQLRPSYNTRPQKLVIKATKNIYHNQEIFLDYGAEYDMDEDTTHSTKYVAAPRRRSRV